MKTEGNKHTLKMLIIVNAKRVIEILEMLSVNDLNSNSYNNSQQTKAELKAKMHELRRDTVKMDKVLLKWERP